ncbi:hypothetical protein FA95DRAFT_1158021 [Auriscalpium vulgare]|uniref:Uncharacterized protein n=1 Tax=Auriscalpium vulgare TaxID=40419 RepID=A0ACB8SA06_9AGAM|nr:hypothetical protein FA95DRAFT_1158021 [Auriscalpium vulgare]
MFTTTLSPDSAATWTVWRWLEARSRFAVQAMDEMMDGDYINGVLPASVGVSESGKDALWALTQYPYSDLYKLEFEVYNFAENDDQVWVHTRLTGETSKKVPYDVESIYIFTMIPGKYTVQAPKIKKIDQFSDTAAVSKFESAVAGTGH